MSVASSTVRRPVSTVMPPLLDLVVAAAFVVLVVVCSRPATSAIRRSTAPQPVCCRPNARHHEFRRSPAASTSPAATLPSLHPTVVRASARSCSHTVTNRSQHGSLQPSLAWCR